MRLGSQEKTDQSGAQCWQIEFCFLFGQVSKSNSRPRQGALRRPFSSVSVDGIMKHDGEKPGHTKRVKVLTDEQKEAIMNLTDPSQLEAKERKRQLAALDRRMAKKDTLPPGVLAKWEEAASTQQKSGAYSKISSIS